MSVLQRLRELETAATPAPWTAVDVDTTSIFKACITAEKLVPVRYQPEPILDTPAIVECEERPDAALIAAARNHLSALLDIAEAADVFLAAFSGAADATFVAARRLSTALAALEAQEAT